MKTLIQLLWVLLVLLTEGPALSACFASDVAKLCCPSACAVKNSPKWERANDVLRGCMKGIGCSDSESKGETVGMRCDCQKVKP